MNGVTSSVRTLGFAARRSLVARLSRAFREEGHLHHPKLGAGLLRGEVTVVRQAVGAACGVTTVSHSMGVNRPRRA